MARGRPGACARAGREMRDTERSSVGTAIGIMLEGCSDPKTREALLEVIQSYFLKILMRPCVPMAADRIEAAA